MLPEFAFTFVCYDKKDPDDDGFHARKNSVDITVKAESEDEALEFVTRFMKRQEYKLETVVELHNGRPIA